MKKCSLQIKITLLVGMVLTAACLGLTINSIYSARGYYSILDDSAQTDFSPGDEESDITIPPEEMITKDSDSLYSTASRQFSIQSVIVMAGVILISVALTYWLTGRLLAPLKNLTKSIGVIDQGKLHQRVVLPQAAGEVMQLTDSFNHMLERLQESFEIQQNFSANAAHELKTPLAVLKTSLQVLEMEEQPSLEDYQEFTCAAKSGIERLTGTVDALLSLTQSEAEKNGEKTELYSMLEQICTELRPRTKEHGITLSLSGDVAFAEGDSVLLYRAFFNLVENAVKYNQENGRVDISLSQEENDTRIRITDTGVGMSEESLRHVFEPFYRADQSRSQKIPGSGLGLSVVNTILERYQGSIRIDSEEGKGTVVTVIFDKV